MQKIIKIIILFIFLFVIGIFYISLTRDTNYNTSSLINKETPEFKIISFDDSNFFTRDDIKKYDYTLINFWASWCGPCRLSLPALNQLKDQFKDRPVQFLAVSIDVVEEDAWDFLSRYSVDYPVVIDTDGDIARLFEVNGMPSGFLVDADGKVREVHVGYKRGDELKLAESIKKILAEMDAS